MPANVPAHELANLIVKALNWRRGCSYQIIVEHSGLRVPDSKTLSEAQAWTGTTLVFKQNCSKVDLPTRSKALAWLKSKATGRLYPLVGNVTLVGRKGKEETIEGENFLDLGLESLGRTVSRRHAKLILKSGKWFIKVEKAKNITVLNGMKLSRNRFYQLSNGDSLQFGGVEVQFLENSVKEER